MTPTVQLTHEASRLAGAGGETTLTDPITITLFQSGRPVSPNEIVTDQELLIRWSEYTGGAADPRGIVDDMIFVVVADVEFPRVIDSRVIRGVPGFTSYATATYLDLRTLGTAVDSSCPDVPPPMDSGQTDRMEPPPGDSSTHRPTPEPEPGPRDLCDGPDEPRPSRASSSNATANSC